MNYLYEITPEEGFALLRQAQGYCHVHTLCRMYYCGCNKMLLREAGLID
jgi:hypothetical protein